MAINMDFNTLQLIVVPQRDSQITAISEQRIAAQNINRIDKKIEFIDKEINAREKYITLLKESKAIIQEEMDIVISILQRRGITVIKQNGVWVENTNSLNGKLSNSERGIDVTKKIELAGQKLTEADKKIEAIEKYGQNLGSQFVVKKDFVVSTYTPTSTQLSTLVRDNHVFNQSTFEEADIKPKYSLPVIYQSQKNIYESILNSLLLKVIV